MPVQAISMYLHCTFHVGENKNIQMVTDRTSGLENCNYLYDVASCE